MPPAPVPPAPGGRTTPARRPGVVLAVLLAVGLVVGLVAWFVIGSVRDSPDTLDDATVRAEVARACQELRSSLEDVTVVGLREEHRAAVVEQNTALATMIERLRGLDADVRAADRPLDGWLDGWDTLLDARERYAQRLASPGDVRLVPPVAPDGSPLADRLDEVADGACTVPRTLVEPYALGRA